MSYKKPKSGEWVQPKMSGYKMACCDCGLVHNLNFRVISREKDEEEGPDKIVQFQVFRNNRATAGMRSADARRKSAKKHNE